MDNDVANCPGERIKAIRHGAQLTQTRFAKSIGLSLHALSSIERNEIIPPSSVLDAIELEYGFRREWVSKGTEPQHVSDRDNPGGPGGKFKIIEGGKKDK